MTSSLAKNRLRECLECAERSCRMRLVPYVIWERSSIAEPSSRYWIAKNSKNQCASVIPRFVARSTWDSGRPTPNKRPMKSPRLRKGEKDDSGNETDHRCDWRCDISANVHAFGSMMRQTLGSCS